MLQARIKPNTKASCKCKEAFTMIGVSKNYFLLKLDAAAGDEPETNTDKTEISKRKGFREGL
jgi:hypothetical protein